MSSQTSGPLARGCCARAGGLAATAAPAAAERTALRVPLSFCCMVTLPCLGSSRIVGDARASAQARYRFPCNAAPSLVVEAFQHRRRGPTFPLVGMPAAVSRAGVVDELLRRRLAPLRGERLFRRHQIGAVGQVEPIAVGPVLVHASPGVGPVVVDLAPQYVPADAPHVLVCAELRQVIVAHGDVVDIGYLEGQMVEPR